MPRLQLRFLDPLFDALFRYFRVSTEREKLGFIVLLGVVLGYGVALVGLYALHFWIIDPHGRPVLCDFVAFWAAGREALHGAATAAYDPHLQHTAEVRVVGHDFDLTFGWLNPPIFLVVAAALALLPYASAFFIWCFLTLAFYAGVVARIAERRIAFVFALAAPWVLICMWVGQNGLFTAGLVGLALLLLERRPLLSGLVLGFLSYKPQFGVLFPVALAAGGYWRAFALAAAATLGLNGAAAAIFGFDTLHGFVAGLASTPKSHLYGGIPWRKIQSLYGLIRALGGPGAVAMAAQLVGSAVVAITVFLSWRSNTSFTLKAATLSAAVLLTTPYVFAYDVPLLAVAIAFLQSGRPLDNVELCAVAGAAFLSFLFLLIPVPTAFGSSLLVFGLALRRRYSPYPVRQDG